MRAGFLLSMVASAVLACPAAANEKPDLPARPLSEAERSAVELALEFGDIGPEAIWTRLDPTAPLYALGHDAALLEISARLGSPRGAMWTLQTPRAAYGATAAIFALSFPSGAEEIVRLEFTTPSGGRLRHLWTLVDRLPAAGPASVAKSAESPGPPGEWGGSFSVVASAGLLLMLAISLPILLRRPGPARRRLRFAAGALLLGACAPAEKESLPVEAPFEPRLAELAAQRIAGTQGALAEASVATGRAVANPAPPPANPAAARIAALWAAESALLRGDLGRADSLLGPADSTDPPLASLLRARLGAYRFRAAASDDYEEVALAGFATDRLRFEQIRLAAILEDYLGETASGALEVGTRSAELWYLAAADAMESEQGDLAEARLRSAWNLRPLPRDELFSEPGLAAIAARPSVFPLFELGSPAEPIVHVSGVRRPVRLPAGAQGRLCGSHYSVRVREFDLELPGAAALAPEATPVLDASSFRGEVERRAFDRLAGVPRGAAFASPEQERLAEIAASALAREGQWDELLELTAGVTPDASAGASELLVRLRAVGLRQTGREEEATAELVRLAQRALAVRRPFPGALYDLAELVAADGRYETAIRLVRKADAQVSRPLGEARIRQFSLSLELEKEAEEHRSAHFLVRTPAGGDGRYSRQIATVLEEERARMMQWIPRPGNETIVVELLRLEDFLEAYAGEVPVLGLFDGRVRMPLADVRSLEPQWIGLVSHELAHAVLSGATRGRAPHWFQEGLAQHAEMGRLLVNPLPDLEATGRTLSFPALEPVLRGFSEPQLVELAYAESAWAVAFIESRGGRDAIRRLVGEFADGASTEKAIPRVLGMDLQEFDRAFRSWAVQRAPAKRLVPPRRFDRELDGPFARETSEAESGRRAVRSVRVESGDPDAPPDESRRSAMAAWHERYLAASAEARELFARIGRAYRADGARAIGEDCGRLRRSASLLVNGRSDALGAPDTQAARELHNAYEAMVRFGERCEQGRTVEAVDPYGAATAAFERASVVLRKYGLEP